MGSLTSPDFLGLSFSAGDFRAGTQKGINVNFENNFQLETCMDSMGRDYLLQKI